MAPSDDQIKVFESIVNMKLKARVTNCILIAFFIVLIFVCAAKTWEDRAVFATLDGILGYTMYPLVKHYFPAVNAARKSVERSKKLPPRN